MFLLSKIDTKYPAYVQNIIGIKLVIYTKLLSNKFTARIPTNIEVNVVIWSFSFFFNLSKCFIINVKNNSKNCSNSADEIIPFIIATCNYIL